MKNTKRKIISLLLIIAIFTLMIGCDKTGQNNSKVQSNMITKDSDEYKSIDLKKSLLEKGYYNYEGTINNALEVKMSLYRLSEEIVGTYSYDYETVNTTLKGKSDKKKIILIEYNESGENISVFQGDMVSVDKIQGVWSNGKNKLPFILSLVNTEPDAQYGQTRD